MVEPIPVKYLHTFKHISTKPVSNILGKIILVTRSASGDDGVYHIVHRDNTMKSSVSECVLKSSENHLSESLCNILAARLKFLVPDMRGTTSSELKNFQSSSKVQECVNSFNKKILDWNKSQTSAASSTCSSSSIFQNMFQDMSSKKILSLSSLKRMLIMSSEKCFDLREENTLEQLENKTEMKIFLTGLSKLFLFDLAIRNYDRFSFIMQSDLFPEVDKKHLWGNLGNLLCSIGDHRLTVIDSITHFPPDIQQYIVQVKMLLKELVNPDSKVIDNDAFATMLKIDDLLEQEFFKGYSYKDKAELAAIARSSLKDHIQEFRNTFKDPDKLGQELKKELCHKNLMSPKITLDIKEFQDNYNFISKVIINAFEIK